MCEMQETFASSGPENPTIKQFEKEKPLWLNF